MPELNHIYLGDCISVMKEWPEDFIDTIITDPPYGLDFMGKDWDGDVPGVHFWTEMLRISKPGAMLLSFGGTRTWHHLATAIENAGWQIRDCLMWLYGSGFPKSHNLHNGFEGWGTALKPAWEPIILAMKPLDGTFAENAEKWGVAGINIDGSRIATQEIRVQGRPAAPGVTSFGGERDGGKVYDQGRWPSNLLLDEEAAGMLDKDNDGASRFFYVAKSAKSERNEGCDELPRRTRQQDGDPENWDLSEGKMRARLTTQPQGNHHPTVKPLDLMKYLCNLTKTPTGGIVLDPFAGSGTTLWAAECHNRPWLGIEMNEEYVKIANARIARERAQIKMAI